MTGLLLHCDADRTTCSRTPARRRRQPHARAWLRGNGGGGAVRGGGRAEGQLLLLVAVEAGVGARDDRPRMGAVTRSRIRARLRGWRADRRAIRSLHRAARGQRQGRGRTNGERAWVPV